MNTAINSATNMTTLSEQDYILCIDDVVKKLQQKDFASLDNLIEEVSNLAKRQCREIRNWLQVLCEHLFKQSYIDLPDYYSPWQITIRNQRQQSTSAP